MDKFLTFLVIIFATYATADITFYKCPNDIPLPLEVTTKSCNSTPCRFIQGQQVEAEITFLASK